MRLRKQKVVDIYVTTKSQKLASKFIFCVSVDTHILMQ